jgi:hypothetical protein
MKLFNFFLTQINSIKTNTDFDIKASENWCLFYQKVSRKYTNKSIFLELWGSFYRSTIPLEEKLEMLNKCLLENSLESFHNLNQHFIKTYNINFIKQRNKEWRCFYEI